MPDELTGATRTRKNTPRIREIEANIKTLVKELAELVEPTDEEQLLCDEQVSDMHSDQVIETMGETMQDLYLITDALDSREAEEEENGPESQTERDE